MKSFCLFLLLSVACMAQQIVPGATVTSREALPDAPSHAKLFRRTFFAAHAILLTSVVYDVEVTHQGLAHHSCVEGNTDLSYHPTRGQLYAENLGIAAGLSAFDYLLHRKHFEPGAYTGAVYGSIVHFHSGTEWFTRGCFD
jgi:hypothetical protein